jgi:hypothetical protein
MTYPKENQEEKYLEYYILPRQKKCREKVTIEMDMMESGEYFIPSLREI